MRSVDYCIHDPSKPAPATPTPPKPTPSPASGPTRLVNNQSGPPLDIVGNNGWPSYRFPLKICQGDCDKDSEVRKTTLRHAVELLIPHLTLFREF